MVVFSSTTFETGYVPDFPAQRKQIRSDLGPRVSFSQLMFRGIAIFHSLKSRIYIYLFFWQGLFELLKPRRTRGFLWLWALIILKTTREWTASNDIV